jgi:CO/xanthine dehydrogenase Mo-binding subunit
MPAAGKVRSEKLARSMALSVSTTRKSALVPTMAEDPRFLRGRGQFVGDLKREVMLHAAILRSPVAHGLVAAVDASAALTMAGVRAVAQDLAGDGELADERLARLDDLISFHLKR